MMQAKIDRVSVCLVRVPLESVTSFATRTVTARDYVLVRVRADDGHAGIGFFYAGHRGGTVAEAATRELLAPMLIGRDPYQVEGLWEALYQEWLLQGRTGLVMRGLSALDIAIWDRNAQAAGLPLHKFLGAYRESTVPAYASGGYYLEGKSPEDLGAELRAHVQAGFRAVKMKVGRLDPAGEEARIRAARAAIGPDVLLMLDANNAWSDVPTALRFMARYEPYDPYWIEEPFFPDDIDNHARLAARTRVPVATGEIEAGRWRFQELIGKQGAAILQPDAAVCGGITEFRKIAAAAAAAGLTICPHWFHDLHVHLVAATPNARFVELFPDDKVLNFRRLLDRQIEIRSGELLLPTGSGLGFGFDEDAVSQFAITDWRTVDKAEI
jgi:L-alanine-DL-glutamate epimerase-like enolase superfamily enzyme